MSLALRRSVWGSLRSASPFSPSQPPETNIEKDQDMHTISKTLHRVRRKKENATPKSKKLVRRIPRTITMTAFDAEGRPPPPELDREVDLVGYREIEEDVPSYWVFEKLHPQRDFELCDVAFFGLPPNVKHLVYSYCFPEEDNKITLSPHFATKAVFDEEYFASPWDILDPVWGGLSASRSFRQELLTYFWTEYHFHVSINPFSGPRFSPLSYTWLPQYLDIIQCLTVEVDLTRFGGSALRYASSIGTECGKLEKLLVELFEGLQKRSNDLMMEELIILSRRYLGNRPVDGTYVTTEDVPWHPDELPFLRTALAGLRGLVKSCRIAGFPLEYTKTTLESMFSDNNKGAKLIEPKDSAWPAIPLYEPPVRAPMALNAYSVVPYAQYNTVAGTTRRGTYGTNDQGGTPTPEQLPSPGIFSPSTGTETASIHSAWEVALHHSTSFTEMFERGLNGSPESLSSHYTTGRGLGDDEEESEEPHMLLINRGHPLLKYGQSYQSLHLPIVCSPASTARDTPRTVIHSPVIKESPEMSESPDTPCPRRLLGSPTKTHRKCISAVTTYSDMLAQHKNPEELVSRPVTPQSHRSKPNSLLRRLSQSPKRSPSSLLRRLSQSPKRRQDSPTHGTPQSLQRSQSSRSPLRSNPSTPTRLRKALPPTVSMMNALNEQDPAFIRTMEALRQSKDLLRPSVDRAHTTPMPRTSGAEFELGDDERGKTDLPVGVKKRYTSFFSRLRVVGSA